MINFDLNHDNASHFGIVNLSVANMRRQPVFQAEIVNQTMLGAILPVFEQQNDFCFVKNWDNYKGWISCASLLEVKKEDARNWAAAAKLIFTGNYGVVTTEADALSEPVSDLATCCLLAEVSAGGDFTGVRLPDGRSGFVNSHLLTRADNQAALTYSPEALIKTARRFLGIPYLWGGTSSKAFDCSGFVQTVFRLLNKNLPRNASQMARAGEEVVPNPDFSNLAVGDLLFYGKSRERIIHVSVYIGGGCYIHADGFVRINSLLPQADNFNQKRRDSLLLVRRIL